VAKNGQAMVENGNGGRKQQAETAIENERKRMTGVKNG